MAPIDPQRLLKCLAPLLDPTSGAIKSDREVDKIYGLMIKYNKRLVSKCIYIHILNATREDILETFMSRGGWIMLNSWLSDAINMKNYALCDEILSHFMVCEPTIERLKQEDIAKMVKILSKDTSARQSTQNLAKQLYTKWVALVKSPMPTNNSGSAAVVNDLTLEEDLTSLDLSNIQFNPEEFNSALNVLDNIDPTVPADSNIIMEDNLVQSQVPAGIIPPENNENKELIQSMNQEYAIIMREGKSFLVKVEHMDQQPVLIESVSDGSDLSAVQAVQDDSAKKRSRKDPTIKKVPGGKPPLRTYSNLSGYTDETKEPKKASNAKNANSATAPTASQMLKKTNESAKVKTAAESVASFAPTKKPPTSENKVPRTTKDTSADSTKKKSGATTKKALTAQQEMEKERELKMKMKEQKRLLKERKKKAEEEALLKAQRARDEETLKSLNLVALGPQNNNKVIPKIPKRPVGFADAIGIPGASEKEKAKKIIEPPKKDLNKKSSIEEKKSSSPTKGIEENSDERKRVISRPKVKVTTRNRGLTLIDDMTKPPAPTPGEGTKNKPGATPAAASQDKDKDKNNEKTEETKSSAVVTSNKVQLERQNSKEKEVSPSKIGKKKRPSSETESNSKEKKQKLDDTAMMEVDEPSSSTPTTPVTPTPPPTKRPGILQESSLFMDALNANKSITSNRDKKRRRSSNTELAQEQPAAATKSTNSKSKNINETSSSAKPVINFYRETLSEEATTGNENNNEKDAADELNISLDDLPPPTTTAAAGSKNNGQLKSILHLHRANKGDAKKSVQWVNDAEIKSYFYFEMDDTERINVSRTLINGESTNESGGMVAATPKDFTEMKKMEKAQERKMRNLFGVKDNMEEQIEWYPPKKIILTNAVEITIASEQVPIQEEREKAKLQAFYFTKADIPDNPDESEAKSTDVDIILPTTIPFDDVPGITKITQIEDTNPNAPTAIPQELPIDQSAAMMDSVNMMNNLGNLAYDPVALAQMGIWNAANPFALAMAAATNSMAGGQLDIWNTASNLGANPQQMIFQQQPPPMLDGGFGGHYQTADYDSRNRSGSMSNRRGGDGGGRRQHSRFDSGPGERRGDFDGRGGGRSRFDEPPPRVGGHRGGGRDFRGPVGPPEPPKRERGTVARTVLCKFYKTGTCKAGAACDFLHPGINGPSRGGRFGSKNNSNDQNYRNNNDSRNDKPRNSTTSSTVDESPASPDPNGSSTNTNPNTNINTITNNPEDENWDV